MSFENKPTRKSRTREAVRIDLDKVPPQAIDAEMAILGAIILERNAFDRVSSLLKAEMFYADRHQQIFSVLSRMSMSGKHIDNLILKEELLRAGILEEVGGDFYVAELTRTVVSSAHIESHARIVYEKWFLREQIRIAGQLLTQAYEDGSDPFENMEVHERELQAISLSATGNAIQHISGVMAERIHRLHLLQQQDTHVTGISSGYGALDRVTHGWQNSDLIILAARPAVGKTAFALNLARNAVSSAMPDGREVAVLLFSLEMSSGQLVDRFMSADSEVPLERFKTGQMTPEVLQFQIFGSTARRLGNWPIFIDDTAALNMFQLRSKCRNLLRKHPQQQWMIIIDYLQLMSGVDDRGRGGNREQEISNISRNLKILAKELNIPIIALSQLSRAVETRSTRDGSKVPQLSDLRESGAIEQDADMVMFLYRPEYYETTDAVGESTKGLTEISIAKHRNGSLAQGRDAIKLLARLDIQKFFDWTNELPHLSPPAGFRKVFESSAARTEDENDLPF